MPRSNNELKDIITELEDGFRDLRTRAEEFQEMRYGHEAYNVRLFNAVNILDAKDRKPGMDSRITERVPFPGGDVLDHACWQTEAILNNTLSFHVPARPGLTERSKEQQRVDKLELFWAHVWGIKFDLGGELRTKTHSGQAGDPFVPWWLEETPFQLPEDDEEVEKYRKSYWPFTLSVKDYNAVAFLADSHGTPTIATLYEDIPYIEVVKRYGEGKEKDRNALTICKEQFPYLRGGRGTGADLEEQDLTRCKARVRIVDDGTHICHSIDIKNSKYADGSGDYAMRDGEVEREYPNHFGRPSLFIVTGRYNHSARELEDRYLPLNDTLRRGQHKLDVAFTYRASIAYTPPKPTVSLPESIAHDLLEGQTMPDSETKADLQQLLGVPGQFEFKLDPAVERLEESLIKARDLMLPSQWLTSPDVTAAAYSTAAAGLSAIETSRSLYDNATQSEIGQMLAVSKAIEHWFCKSGAMAGSKKGEKLGQEKLYINLRGEEPSKQNAMRYIAEHGSLLEITPDDFENDVIEISIKASTEAQKQQEYQLVAAQAQAGYLPPEMVLEKITNDVSGLKKQLEGTRRYQRLKPSVDRRVLAAAIELMNTKGRMDVSSLFLPLILPEPDPAMEMDPQANGNGGSPPRPPNSIITQNTGAPATSPSAARVQG